MHRAADRAGGAADRRAECDALDAFMEFNVGLWVSDLDYYTRLLQVHGYKHLPLEWRCPATNATFYSVVAWIGGTATIVELDARVLRHLCGSLTEGLKSHEVCRRPALTHTVPAAQCALSTQCHTDSCCALCV